MTSDSILSVTLSAVRSGQRSEGAVRIQQWDKKARTARAVRAWVVCWISALLSVFIPLLHFILVPALLLAGPVAAFFIVAQESVILGGEATCPVCRAALPIPRQTVRFPIADLCPGCQAELRIDAHFAPAPAPPSV